jgi:peptidoglycan/xylan/chitin deacetylase (PgdA/CDA1 family)
MYRYFIKTPWIIKKLFSSYLWSVQTKDKEVYLSFDDGPHPEVTPFVLRTLKQYNALATFFCLGKNVVQYPVIYQQVLKEGHSVGNHSFNHLNGWNTSTVEYSDDIRRASSCIYSNLFRPPYGKIKRSQAREIKEALQHNNAKIIMWDVLSGDFDTGISKEECLANVLGNYTPGSVIVFHDSEKAYPHLQFVLPLVLETLQKEGYVFKAIETEVL